MNEPSDTAGPDAQGFVYDEAGNVEGRVPGPRQTETASALSIVSAENIDDAQMLARHYLLADDATLAPDALALKRRIAKAIIAETGGW